MTYLGRFFYPACLAECYPRPEGVAPMWDQHSLFLATCRQAGVPTYAKAVVSDATSDEEVRECARLQSFPDWFDFRGKFTTGGDRRTRECPRYTQVGNAVPPLLAEAIGQAILKMIEDLHIAPSNG